ncbi:MAG: VPLPA-CTERM sorting domain-containing protein [Proteobacteria bacterium]|nr:VPLPA-CTERM sorting domain-containing protein [Pseudomonadota bacterium]
MKMKYWQRSSAITLSVFVILGITEGNSLASSVSASAEMSWASLQITGSGEVTAYNPTTWASSVSRAGTYEDWTIPTNPYVFDDIDDRAGIVSTFADSSKANTYGSAYGFGRTDTIPGQRNIIASASAFATNYEDFSAIATAERDKYYQVTTTGDLIFSINYTLDSIDIDASDGYGWADILAYTYLYRYNSTKDKWVKISIGTLTREKASDLIDFDDYIYGPKTGTIKFTYAATAGQLLHFGAGVTAKASAASAVPLPGAVWLLGSGLLGMIAIRRKSAQ